MNLLDFIPKALEDTLQNFGVSDLPFEVSPFYDHRGSRAVFPTDHHRSQLDFPVPSPAASRRSEERHRHRQHRFPCGFAVGVLKGTLFVFLFLAFMFPLRASSSRIGQASRQLNSSYIAGPLYDINPLLLLLKKFSL